MKYGVILIYLIMFIVQILNLKTQKSKKELVIALVLTVAAFLYTYGYLQDWKLPTVDTVLHSMFDPLAQKVFGSEHTQ